jgi:glycopeptide antibiotics resistance protein
MGKPEVRVIAVRKWVTLLLLVLVSASMVGLISALSGRAYARRGPPPFGEVKSIAERIGSGGSSVSDIVVLTMPIALNALLFVPWGFLMFVWIDRPGRSPGVSYALTFGVGTAFALTLAMWQGMLPSGVVNVSDAAWNGVGALAGATLGQIRKRVRVAFQ